MDAATHPARTTRRAAGARALPALLFLCAFAVFLGSPNHQMTDSGYALLVSENLIRHGDLDLARYQLESARGSNYRLEHTGAHTTYFFPVGSSLLSVPFVVLSRLAGQSIVRPDGTYATKVEGREEAILAALLMAVFAVIVFSTARLILPLPTSLAVALVGAFGTQVYSTASRTLWSDTWALVLVAGAIHLLLRSAARGEGRRFFWLATLECWATFVRPTSGLTLAATTFYLLLVDRRASWAFFATTAFWLAAFAADSLRRVGTPFPSYFHDRLGPPSPEALLGTLLSPSRGLLVCVPATLAVGWICWRHRKALRFATLTRVALTVCSRALAGDLGVRQMVGRPLLRRAARDRDGPLAALAGDPGPRRRAPGFTRDAVAPAPRDRGRVGSAVRPQHRDQFGGRDLRARGGLEFHAGQRRSRHGPPLELAPSAGAGRFRRG